MLELANTFSRKKDEVFAWVARYEDTHDIPLYTSVDLRDGGFKTAIVDTNLFPAGFNNLCEHGVEDATKAFREAILERVKNCKSVLVLAEEHTRNTWYLENVRILADIIEKAGFCVRVATFLDIKPLVFCEGVCSVELVTATGHTLKVYSLDKLLKEMSSDACYPDFILVNNDLMGGIPAPLKEARIPIYPSVWAGWHTRKKSRHFEITQKLIGELAEILGCDPWKLSCLDTSAGPLDIYSGTDREALLDAANDLFRRIESKYKEHAIDAKPFIFVKADAGTYGMGILPIEDPMDIRAMNRRNQNKLYKGKGGIAITHYLLQEGVPTVHEVGGHVAEVCLYHVTNRFVGGFYRVHEGRSGRESLNTQGMNFHKMCPRTVDRACGIETDKNLVELYILLARVAGIAARIEVSGLETMALAGGQS